MNNNSIKYFQDNLDDNTIYIFIDESGGLHSKNIRLIEKDIKEKGYVENNNKSYTLTSLVIYSLRQYEFLRKEMVQIKKEFFPNKDIENLVLHRTDLKNTDFLSQNNLSHESAYFLEQKINSLIIKHKLKTFSVSFNKEIFFNNPNNKNQLNNFLNINKNIKNIILLKLLKTIQRSIKKKNLNQRIILIMETKNKKEDKETVEFVNNLIKEKKLWIFKKILITKKVNKNMKPILGNELVDFVCYSYFLWSSISLYHNSKFLLHNYPNHYKNSLSLITNLSKEPEIIQQIKNQKKLEKINQLKGDKINKVNIFY
ncbi:MAG: hypothetical protein ACRC8P_03835 [Spiroplasma sp.]